MGRLAALIGLGDEAPQGAPVIGDEARFLQKLALGAVQRCLAAGDLAAGKGEADAARTVTVRPQEEQAAVLQFGKDARVVGHRDLIEIVDEPSLRKLHLLLPYLPEPPPHTHRSPPPTLPTTTP